MHTVTDDFDDSSRRGFCRALGAAFALPLFAATVHTQTPVGDAGGAPMLPVRSPGLEHLGLTVPDPEAAAKFYGRIFGPQLFREREPPPRYYVMAGTAYLAFGGSATATPFMITSVRSCTTIAGAKCDRCSKRAASSRLVSA
jgi:glyoxalase/bleomycin resistance protein/dioxygenase superfamily protein